MSEEKLTETVMGKSDADSAQECTKGENLSEEICRAFDLKPVDPSQYSPLALAYMGDNVYEFVSRTYALHKGNRQSEKLHAECAKRARAGAQAEIAAVLFPMLSEEEAAVYKRGRNANVYTKAKNASMAEYHEATGLEALIGYLYLRGEYGRLAALLKAGFEALGLL